MMAEAILLAALLHRPALLVDAVYQMAGIDGVAVVEMESQFHERAFRVERDADGVAIGTSYGLFKLFDKYHPQYRDDLLLHLAYGAGFWRECKARAGGDIARAYSIWNSGNSKTSIVKGIKVERKARSLEKYLWMKLR